MEREREQRIVTTVPIPNQFDLHVTVNTSKESVYGGDPQHNQRLSSA
jgi:hypothetical protein